MRDTEKEPDYITKYYALIITAAVVYTAWHYKAVLEMIFNAIGVHYGN